MPNQWQRDVGCLEEVVDLGDLRYLRHLRNLRYVRCLGNLRYLEESRNDFQDQSDLGHLGYQRGTEAL